MTDFPLRIGLIGCGRHAQSAIHPSARLNPKIDLVACCDIDPEQARISSRRFGIPQIYTDHQQMLTNEKLDGVIIVTGPSTHPKLAIDCLATGVPVFVEKPPGSTIAEVEQMYEASKASGLPIAVGFMMRYRPATQWVKGILANLEYPVIQMNLSVSLLKARSKVAGYPSPLYFLLSVGVHYFDLIQYYLGKIESLSALRSEYDDTHFSYSIQIKCQQGTCLANLNSCGKLSYQSTEKMVSSRGEYYELVGKETQIIMEDCFRGFWYKPDGSVEFHEPSNLYLSFQEAQSLHLAGYYQEIDDFIEALMTKKSPLANIKDGLSATKVVFAVYESAQHNGERLVIE